MEYLQQLKQIFAQPDLRQAHKEAVPILEQAVRDKEFFSAVIRQNFSDPDFLDRVRNYPTLSIPIEENESFTLRANCFLPLPDGNTDVTFQSIHHHGSLLLTTISAFGSGYDSILFEPGYTVDQTTGLTNMKGVRYYHNELHNYEFVDKFTPHVVFYPTNTSITFALWSHEKHQALDKVKKLGVLQKVKKPLKQIIKMAGLNAAVGINEISFNDFYPEDGKIIGMRDRIDYPHGTNDNWLQNVFSIAQQYGFDDMAFMQRVKTDCEQRGQLAPIKWIDRFIAGEKIDLLFEQAHLNIAKVNLHKKDIFAAIDLDPVTT